MSIKKGYKVIAGAPLEPVWGTISGNITDQEDLQQALSEKISINSPAFTGTPTAPTPPSGSDDDRLATTSYVQRAIESVDGLPSQTGHNGQFLTTNGTDASWATVDALPAQSGQSGKFLSTNGISASWKTIDLSEYQLAKTAVTHTENTAVGSTTKPVYINSNGVATELAYSLNKTVPSDAKFTDTTYEAGFGLKMENNKIKIEQANGTYRINGTLSEVDGVYSGFSSTNFIATIGLFPLNPNTSRIITRASVGTNGSWQTLFSKSVSSQHLVSIQGYVPKFFGFSSITQLSTTPLSVGNTYWFCVDDDGTNATYYTLVDNNYSIDSLPDISSWTAYSRVSHSTYNATMSNASFVFGKNNGNNSELWAGGIDISNTRMYANNELIWEPILADTSNMAIATPSVYGFVIPDNRSIVINNGVISYNNANGYITGSSPALAGTPTAPTAAAGTNTTQIATTEFVQTAINSVDALPTQAGNNGKFLTTDGTNASWATVDTLPSQSGQSGKFLTTNGTTASWASFNESDLVHKSGDETITGTKSFESTLQLKNNLTFRSYGSNDSGRLQFRAQPSDNVIRGAVAITDGYSTSGSGYTGFVAQMVAREGSTTSEPFNTMRVSNKGIEYIKEANDGTITGQYILIGSDGIVPQARLASGGTNGQVLMTNGTSASWADASGSTITYWEDD